MSKLMNVCLMKTQFQMVGPTRNTPNGFGASGSGDPPPPPLTPTEALLTAQTNVLRQLLQMQQQMDQRVQQLEQRPPHGANHEGPHTVTTYTEFIGMKPPTFSKAKEPLEADAWVTRGKIFYFYPALLRGAQGKPCDLATSG
jgi:hypothetical protein